MDKTWTLTDLRSALAQFERDLRSNGYKDNTVFTYVDRSSRFLNYLEGTFSSALPDVFEDELDDQPDVEALKIVLPHGPSRSSREDILDAVGDLADASLDGTFTAKEVLTLVKRRGTHHAESTISTMVSHFMTANSTCNSSTCPGTHTDDLFRVGRGRYRLNR